MHIIHLHKNLEEIIQEMQAAKKYMINTFMENVLQNTKKFGKYFRSKCVNENTIKFLYKD